MSSPPPPAHVIDYDATDRTDGDCLPPVVALLALGKVFLQPSDLELLICCERLVHAHRLTQ